VTAGAKEFDPQKRKAIYSKFQILIQEQVPVIHLVNEMSLMAAQPKVSGIQYSGAPTWGLWNIAELKID
jgi:peptide/nickel transport system substrate-binding protein